MDNGKVYGVGIGPGDSDLLTIKAVNILNEVDVIFCPEKKRGAGSFAYDIVKPHLKKEVHNKYLTFPMHHHEEKLKNYWIDNANILKTYTTQGKDVAFIMLGDPTIYSTFMNLVPYLKKESVDIEIVPGITSFCAVAGRLITPIVTSGENFAVVALKKGEDKMLANALDDFQQVIVMKPSHNRDLLVKELTERKLENNFVMVSKCSTGEETIISDMDQLAVMDIPYLSTVFIKKGGEFNE